MGKNKDAVKQSYLDLNKQCKDTAAALKKAKGIEKVRLSARLDQLKNKVRRIDIIFASEQGGKIVTQKFLNNPKYIKAVNSAYGNAKRNYIAEKLGFASTDETPDIKEFKFSVNLGEKVDVTNKINEALDKYAKKHLSAADYQSYLDDVFAIVPQSLLLKYPEETIDIYLDGMTEEMAAECKNKIDECKLFDDCTPEELTVPIKQNLIPSLIEKATIQEEKDALDFIVSNVRVAIPEYNSFLGSNMTTRMNEMPEENERVRNAYFEKHPEYKDVITTGMSGGYEMDVSKKKTFDELYNAEYRLSDKTKGAIKQIMHKLDEMNIVNLENINVAEEGIKVYGMSAAHKATVDIAIAMEKGEVERLPHLVENYKTSKSQCDELLKIANDNFSDNPLLFGANVDVDRTVFVPLEYRRDSKGVSQVSEILNCLKLCKRYNIPIDDFVEKPKHYLTLIKQDFFRKYDVNELAKGKSLGQTLYMIANPPSEVELNTDISTLALIMRAEEGFKCFDPDETEYNTMLHEFSLNVGYDNLSMHINKNYMDMAPEDTIKNMVVFGEGKKIQEYTGNMTAHYDFVTNKQYEPLDADDFIKKSEHVNYDEMSFRLGNMYKDYMAACILDGKHPKASIVDMMKKMPDKIIGSRKKDAQDAAFLRFKEKANKFTTEFALKDVVEIIDGAGKPELSEKAKNASLNYLKSKQYDYARLDLSTRFFGWFPFVYNKATNLRHNINAEKAFLVSKGVDKNVVNREVGNYINNLPVEKVQGNTIKFGKPEDIKIFDVSAEKVEGYDIEADMKEYNTSVSRDEINVEEIGSLSSNEGQNIHKEEKIDTRAKAIKENNELDKSNLEEFIDVNQIDLDKSGIFDPEQIKKMLEDADKEYGNLDDLDNDKLHEKLAESSNLDTSTKKTEMVSINDSPAIKKTVEP